MAISIALFAFIGTANATNLALSGTATASQEKQAAAFAIDGDDGTRWETESADPQWLAITLDDVYSIDNIKIHWEGASAKTYTVKVSTDSASWTQVYSMSDGTGSRWDNISFTAVDAKYIVMEGTERSTEWGYSIYELEVYEAIPDAQNATLSDLKVDDSTITGFASSSTEYTYLMTGSSVPTVTATATITGADVDITPATSIPGTTTIEVTATDGTTTSIYKVNFIQPVTLPLDFESSTLNYNLSDFGAPISIIGNPQISGINTSSQVVQIIKNAGADWAGSIIEIDEPIDLSSETRVTAKFYSPRADINMLLKLETAAGYAMERIIPTTVANQWETLTFDFEGIDLNQELVKVVIICDRATVGDGTADHTYLVDDIKVYEADPAKDATLSDLMVDGTTIANFASSELEYTYIVSSSTVPATTATATVTGADVDITPATSIPGTTTIEVTSTDGTESEIYSIQYVETPISEYCETEVTHLNIEAEVNSAILLTISNIDATSMYVEVESATATPIASTNLDPISGATISDEDKSVAGKIKRIITFAETPTSDVVFTMQWNNGGNYIIYNITVPFTAECTDPGVPTNLNAKTTSGLSASPNPVENNLSVNLGEHSYTQFAVYSISGKCITSQVVSNEATSLNINMSAYESGVYMIQLSNEQESQVLRVLKK